MDILSESSDSQNPFTTFLFSTTSLSATKTQTLHTQLLQNPEWISDLLNQETLRALFLSDFSQRALRLHTFLQSISPTINQDPAKNWNLFRRIVSDFAIKLLTPEFDSSLHSLPGFSDLLIEILRLSYVTRGKKRRGAGYRMLLETVSRFPVVMRGILPHSEGAKVLELILKEAQSGTEVQCFGTSSDEEMAKRAFLGWGREAWSLCKYCTAGHCVSEELDRWDELLVLRDALVSAWEMGVDARMKQRESIKRTILPKLTEMRVLTKDDKKSGLSWDTPQHETKPQPEEERKIYEPSSDHQLLLQTLKIPVPDTISKLEAVIGQIEKSECMEIFQRLLRTFPCAACMTTPSSRTGIELPRNTLETRNRLDTLPRQLCTTLFGRKLGPWKVCISQAGFENLKNVNKEGYFIAIAKKLRELASGDWNPKSSLMMPLSPKMRQDAGTSVKLPVWRAKYSAEGRILWQVEVRYDEDVGKETQVVVVWRIGKPDEIEEAIKDVLTLQRFYTPTQIKNRKLSRDQVTSQGCILPRTFVNRSEENEDKTDDNNPKESGEDHGLSASDKAESASTRKSETEAYHVSGFKGLSESDKAAQEILMNNKYYCITGKVLDRIFSAKGATTIDFPFDVSEEETEIIKETYHAAFILGRSGTGKTTCLLFKLLCRFIEAKERDTPIRQIFLTRSTFLAERLKHYLYTLIDSQLGASTQSSLTESESGNSDDKKQKYTLKESEDQLRGMTLENIDDMIDRFPVVCSFDELLCFLESCVRRNTNRQDFSGFEEIVPSGASKEQNSSSQARLINYTIFREDYWHLISRGMGGYEPDLVFSEILGIIKGSTSSERDFQPLSLEEYCKLTPKEAPVFYGCRMEVYSMYKYYEMKKERFGDRDDIDRVTSLLRAIEGNEGLRYRVQDLFDEVYVDEIQDQKLLEVDLLLGLARNPQGIHFAGDTAQCISRDSTFRFQVIKARFYHHFLATAQARNDISLAKPELIKLAKNYRSHQGILSLAADIVKMLYIGFPAQIDTMNPEVGSAPGECPIVFTGFDEKVISAGGAGQIGTEAGLACFGAEQVIIVRDDAAKATLKKNSRLKSAIILTILQSKGLEFDDVILYNFFSDSNWDGISMRALKPLCSRAESFTFDSHRYAGLCSELKHLYVAVTRARKNLWIIESHRPAVHNMLNLWTTHKSEDGRISPLVSVIDRADPCAEAIALEIIKPGKSTTPEAWINQGEQLIQRELYEDALLCFRRAHFKQGKYLAKAYIYHQRASAKGDMSSDENNKEELYRKAAVYFQKAKFIRKAAVCWDAVGEPLVAANLLFDHKDYSRAAPLYEKGREYERAAECYDIALEYDNAATAYRKGEKWESLIKYLNKNQKNISTSLRKRYSGLANILLKRGEVPKELLPEAKETLGDIKDQEDFYKLTSMTEELLELHVQKSNYEEIFNLMLREGRLHEALEVAEKPEAHGSLLPLRTTITTLYNVFQSEVIWKCAGLNFHNPQSSHFRRRKAVVQKTKCSWLHGARSGWALIAENLDWMNEEPNILSVPMRFHSQPRNDEERFFVDFGNVFIDLFELLNVSIINSERLESVDDAYAIPVETICEFARIAGDLLVERRRSNPMTVHPSLLAALGVLTIPNLDGGQRQALVLEWSPFHELPQGDAKLQKYPLAIPMSIEDVYSKFTSWLAHIVGQAGSSVISRIREIEEGRKKTCYKNLLAGCLRCDKSHDKLCPRTYKERVMSLLRNVSLGSTCIRLYYFKEMGDQENFRPNSRFHQELLLRELTFVSAITQDVKAQAEAWSLISTPDYHWRPIHSSLDSLLFHRLTPPLDSKRSTFSGLLGEMDLAFHLGDSVFIRFMRTIKFREPFYRHWELFRECQSMRSFYKPQYGFHIDRLDSVIQRVVDKMKSDPWETFPRILPWVEMVALELLRETSRSELLVPESRIHLMQLHTTGTHMFPEVTKLKLQKLLIHLLNNLCERLLKASADRQPLLLRNGRTNPGEYAAPISRGSGIIVRRALEFLALCMVNMGLGQPDFKLPMGFGALRDHIMQVDEHWRETVHSAAVIGWTKGSIKNMNDLGLRLCRIFRNYNKDKLVVVPFILDPTKPVKNAQSRFKNLFPEGVEVFTPPATTPSHNSSAPGHTATPTQQDSPTHDDDVEHKPEVVGMGEARAVKVIIRFWKKYYPRLQEMQKRRKEMMATPAGVAEIFIENLKKKTTSPEQTQVLTMLGIPLFAGILKLQKTMEHIEALAKEGLTSPRSKPTLLERIQYIMEVLIRRRPLIQEARRFFDDPEKLLAMGVSLLRTKMENALPMLRIHSNDFERFETELDEKLGHGRAMEGGVR